jgi:hypothetical protein
MRRTTLTSTCKNEALQPHTMAVIIGNFSGLFYRLMQQYSSIQINYIELLFGRCAWCGFEVRQEALQQ